MPTTGSIAGIAGDQFLQLLVAQLQNQDPLDPVSDKDFVAQIASLNTVQSLTDLNASFAQMLQLQQLTQGAELLGKTVTYNPAGGGDAVSGKVDSVSALNGEFVLNVGTAQVKLDQIQSVA